MKLKSVTTMALIGACLVFLCSLYWFVFYVSNAFYNSMYNLLPSIVQVIGSGLLIPFFITLLKKQK